MNSIINGHSITNREQYRRPLSSIPVQPIKPAIINNGSIFAKKKLKNRKKDLNVMIKSETIMIKINPINISLI